MGKKKESGFLKIAAPQRRLIKQQAVVHYVVLSFGYNCGGL